MPLHLISLYQAQGFFLHNESEAKVDMAFTLEAVIVVPLTAAITLGIINTTAHFYKQIEMDSALESEMIYYTVQNHEIWSTKVEESGNASSWSKSTAVNPVKIKQTVELVIDTTSIIGDEIPVLKEIKGAILSGNQK